jgi:hypothetical protein
MIGAAVEDLCVKIRARVMHKPVEEIFHQFGLQIAHQPNLYTVFVDERRASAEIHRDYGERFIHRLHEVARAVYAFAITQSLREELAHHNADVLHGVVLIDIKIALRFDCEIEAAMFGEQLQHVVEEPDSGGDTVLAPSFDAQVACYPRFFGVALNLSGSGQLRPPVD